MSATPEGAATGPASDSMAVHNDWFPSGWMRVLPRHQSFMLCMIFSTAAVRHMREPAIGKVAEELFGTGLPGVFHGVGDSLDSPVMWLEPDDLDEADNEQDAARIRADAEARQAACQAALEAAGLRAPSTIRDLADIMVALGIASYGDGVWTMPETLPLPEDVLPLPHSLRQVFGEMRRVGSLEGAEQAIIHHLTRKLEYPDELLTSGARWRRETSKAMRASA
ncbi:DUF6042 family protein [Streptomyces sp. NPDC059989]|uniref:DUF6042 family protein n=1 Tax=Streptomyces sp. NPDC059989 TaxID=3347026 RepID=UPI00367BFDB6